MGRWKGDCNVDRRKAQVPPWFMALVSMGMSVFFLCVQYPLMHRLYHRETDDVLHQNKCIG